MPTSEVDQQKKSKPASRIEETLQTLSAAARLTTRHWLKDALGQYDSNLNSFYQLRGELSQRVQACAAPGLQSPDSLEALAKSVEKLSDWANGVPFVSIETPPEAIWQEWRSAFAREIVGLPTRKHLSVRQSGKQIGFGDSFIVQLRKHVLRAKLAFADALVRTTNGLRALIKKAPAASSGARRTFQPGLFLRFHFELPVAAFQVRLWQEVLHEIAVQLEQIHQGLAGLLDTIVGASDGTSDDPPAREQSADESNGPASPNGLKNWTEVDLPQRQENFLVELNAETRNWWDHAGTLVLPESSFNARQCERGWQELQAALLKDREEWHRYFQGAREELLKDLELAALRIQTVRIHEETTGTIRRRIEEAVLPAFAEPIDVLTKSKEKFDQASKTTESNVEESILSESRLTLRNLRRQQLPHALDAIQQVQLGKALTNYSSRIKHAIEELPESPCIVTRRNLEATPPKSKIDEIPLRDLVLNEIFPDVARSHTALMSEMEQKLEKMSRTISEIDQIIEFNLDSALDVLQQDMAGEQVGEAQSVAAEGLQRAKNQLNLILDECTDIQTRCTDVLTENTSDFINQVRLIADNERIVELKLRAAKAKARQELRLRYSKTLTAARNALPGVLAFLATSTRKIEHTYFRFKKVTGLGSLSAETENSLARFLTTTKTRLGSLPHVYQRLFKFEPLSDERFFSGRETEMRELAEEFSSWRTGHHVITAVIGEKGSGRTTMINFCEAQLYKGVILRKILLEESDRTEEALVRLLADGLQLADCQSLGELQERIEQQDQRIVCIVENLHNLFLRTVDGFDLLERFLLFMSSTHDKIYWLVTCGLHGWGYLDKVLGVSRFFTRTFHLQELSRESIESIIWTRHRVSGYHLTFDIPEEIAGTRKFRKFKTDEQRQDYLRGLFFEALSRVSAGNITAAMLFWLRSVKKITSESIVINPQIEFDDDYFSRLPAGDLFSLAAFLQHETLTVQEHAEVLNEPVAVSSLSLTRMQNQGILTSTPSGCKIHPFLYRPVVRALKTKNILH